MKTKFLFYLSPIVLVLVLLMASNNNLLGLEIETPETSLLEEILENDDLLEDYAFALVPFSTKDNSPLNFFYTENNYGDKYLKVESPPPRSVVFLS